MPRSKNIKQETCDQWTHTKQSSRACGEPITESERTPRSMEQWIRDLEIIFEKAMKEDKLNIALKAKELLARNKGWIAGGVASTPLSIKSIDQWTLQEVNALIAQLDAYGDPDAESGRPILDGTESQRHSDPKESHKKAWGTQPLDGDDDCDPKG